MKTDNNEIFKKIDPELFENLPLPYRKLTLSKSGQAEITTIEESLFHKSQAYICFPHYKPVSKMIIPINSETNDEQTIL